MNKYWNWNYKQFSYESGLKGRILCVIVWGGNWNVADCGILKQYRLSMFISSFELKTSMAGNLANLWLVKYACFFFLTIYFANIFYFVSVHFLFVFCVRYYVFVLVGICVLLFK